MFHFTMHIYSSEHTNRVITIGGIQFLLRISDSRRRVTAIFRPVYQCPATAILCFAVYLHVVSSESALLTLPTPTIGVGSYLLYHCDVPKKYKRTQDIKYKKSSEWKYEAVLIIIK